MSEEELMRPVLPSEALLKSLDVGTLLEKDRKVVWANRRFFDLLGYEQEDITGQSTRRYFHSDQDYLRFNEGMSHSAELALLRKDGTLIWCHVSVNMVDEHDAGKGFLWSFSDISEQVGAEQRAADMQANLNRTLAKQQAIFRSLQVGVLLVKDRRVEWANERFYSILRFAQKDMINKSTRIYFCNDEDFESVDHEGYPLLRAGQPYSKELKIMRGDGCQIWCHIIGNVVDLNDLSQGFIWSFADITDRIQAERQMREAQASLADTLARQQAILRSLQVGVLLAKDRKVVWANQRFFDMLGYTEQELVGQFTSVYFRTEEGYASIDRYGYPLLREGKSFMTELPLTRKDDSQIWCHITGNAVDLHNFDQGFIWSFADVTDRIEAEGRARAALEHEQLMEAEKMAALGMVVAGVAHEINTPIGVSYTLVTHFRQKTREFLDSFASGAMKRSDLQRFVELSGEMSAQLVTNVTRAADLIQSFKQIAVDQSRDDRRDFNLKEYLHEIVTSLMPNLRKTPHKIHIDCPDDIEMDSYPGALSQVITNLVMNATIHAFDEDKGGVMIIGACRKGTNALISFADDGKGISAENLPKIFDPFFTTRRGAGGSGLGLNIVFNLITSKLQGRVSCDSTPGEGAVFEMEIPLVIDSSMQKTKEEQGK